MAIAQPASRFLGPCNSHDARFLVLQSCRKSLPRCGPGLWCPKSDSLNFLQDCRVRKNTCSLFPGAIADYAYSIFTVLAGSTLGEEQLGAATLKTRSRCDVMTRRGIASCFLSPPAYSPRTGRVLSPDRETYPRHHLCLSLGEATTSCCCSSCRGIAKLSSEVASESRSSDVRGHATLDAPLDGIASVLLDLLCVPLRCTCFQSCRPGVHLALFYLFGRYHHLSDRALCLRAVSMAERPYRNFSYRPLGALLLAQVLGQAGMHSRI